MPIYHPPVDEFRFLLQEAFDYEKQVSTLPGLDDATMDVVSAVLIAAGDFSRDVLLPINLAGDDEGCRLDAGGVHTPAGYSTAYDQYRDGGWSALSGEPGFGGQGLPASLALFVREFIASGSMAFGMYAGLSGGAYRALLAHGSEELKQRFLPSLIEGSVTGTMCMTEPESGSDLSRLRTRAVPDASDDDGSYRITGNKIFISGGDHDLTSNILHLVLARLPDAPPGTRGISLFIVPKRLSIDDASLPSVSDNGVTCTSIEHKMGIRASATAALSFDGSKGWLIGEPHGGLRAMFTMMNSSRMGVAVQSMGVAELSWQNARAYAQDRRQGRAPVNESASREGAARNALAKASGGMSSAARRNHDPDDLIVAHPDVRKSLLTMKALVEGCRALYVESAIALDVRARHVEAQARTNAEDRLALMTPVLKAFISDCAVEVTRLGVAVYGGHGYIHEHGMEQLMRDAMIVPLYEGTNAIQALDLVHRKLSQDDGRAVRSFINEVAALIALHRGDATQHPLCPPLERALVLLDECTTLMQQRSVEDAVSAASSASDYLRLFGLVALGTAWVRMAAAASRMQGSERSAFHEGKRKTARFFLEHLLPDTERLARSVRLGSSAIMAIAAEEL
jgi:alkylation response protein AidB-like acyl-CoA dehydrogenase